MITQARYDRARAWAAHWCQRWFLGPDGNDRLQTTTGAAAGWASHVEVYLLLLTLAREELGEQVPAEPFPDRLKARGYDRMARAWGLRVTRSSQTTTGTNGRVAFVVEVPTPSMSEPIGLVAGTVPPEQRVILCADPRALRALRVRGLDAVALVLPLAEQQRVLRTESRHIAAALQRLSAQPPSMVLNGRDLAPQALERLGRTLRRSLPWLAAEHLALRRSIERTRPGALAIASDQHRIGRLTTSVGRELGIPVTVLQHGLPQAKIGFLPVVADRIAAWSEDSAAWFRRGGTDPDRIVVLGNPRSDRLVSAQASHRMSHSGDHTRLLLALSPAAPSTNARVVETVLEALATMPECELVIKLHPGHREWGWVGGHVSRAALSGKVRVAQHEDMVELLRWADVTLVHRSTVALESLVAGTPVVVVASDAPSVAELELAHLELSSAGDTKALSTAIATAIDPAERSAWFGRRASAIATAAGPLDGEAASRIAQLLIADATRGDGS